MVYPWKAGTGAVFTGEFQHTIDDKGRLTVPAAFREELGESFVVTRGLDACLFLFPDEEWRRIEARLRDLPLTRSDSRAFARFFFSGAAELSLDKQGRILVPSHLREYASMDRDAVVIGVSSRAEIWSKDRWETYAGETSESFNEIAEQMVDLNL